MIKHIVLWAFKDAAAGKSRQENMQEAKRRLEALNGRIPGLIRLEVGIDVTNSPDPETAGLYSEFEDLEALERYLQHPEHLRIREFMHEVRSFRLAVDYEADGV